MKTITVTLYGSTLEKLEALGPELGLDNNARVVARALTALRVLMDNADEHGAVTLTNPHKPGTHVKIFLKG